MDVHPVIVFLGGLVVIMLGAELVLRGASRIAAMLGIKPIIIGLTIVSVGNSMPELAVCITAVSEGNSDLAVGNIAGTNVLNILFILGLSAAIRSLPLQALSIKLDVPVMIAAAIGLIIMSIDGILSRGDGLILVFAAVAYVFVLVKLSKKETPRIQQEFAEEYSAQVLLKDTGKSSWQLYAVLLSGGMILNIIGADLLVSGAVRIAHSYGISDVVIGLTIVAIGTSAPELATTIVATIKNDRDVAIGNLIGSSICNILVILGLTCIVAKDGVTVGKDVLWLDLPLAAGVAIACYPVFRSDKMVSRTEGVVFVSLYLIYLASLIFFRA